MKYLKANLSKINSKVFKEKELLELDTIDFKDLSNKKGVYVITSTDKTTFIYPNGTSDIIYIGTSINIAKRLKDHIKALKFVKSLAPKQKYDWWIYGKYQYMDKYGAKVFIILTNTNKNNFNLERDIIELFYNKRLSLPIGNANFSYGKLKKSE